MSTRPLTRDHRSPVTETVHRMTAAVSRSVYTRNVGHREKDVGHARWALIQYDDVERWIVIGADRTDPTMNEPVYTLLPPLLYGYRVPEDLESATRLFRRDWREENATEKTESVGDNVEPIVKEVLQPIE